MTAFMVVVAQTKIGFLTGGRGQRFRGLPEEERHTQEEEAYARATVALTRARKMCVIFCPLDMKGLIGAATVMGSLMYGAGHCWHGTISMHLRGSSLEDCPGDDQFLSSLDHNDVPGGTMAQRRYPPEALIECVADITQKHHKVRHLQLTLPLKFGVNRLDGLVVGYLMELMATHSDASKCRKQISSFAKTLTVRVATYLAKEIASLFRPVLYHPLMSLTEEDTLPLLTSEFWVRPVYEELLHAASRFNLSPDAERKRPTSNLVKIASHVKSKPGDAMNQGDQHTTMTDWLGADCPVDFLNVWFPAH